MTLRHFLLIPVLAALNSACLFSVEANVPDVEITQRGVQIPGVPQASLLGDVSVSSSFTLSSDNTAWAKHMNSHVFLRQVTVAATDGVPDLAFIKYAHLTMSSPAAPGATTGATTELINYERCDEAEPSSVIQVDMPTPIDITPIWSADQTVIDIAMAGQLPEEDWTVDVTLKVAGKITFKY
jgi:hypothetical protein